MRKRIFEIIEVAGENDKISSIYDAFMLIAIVASILPLCFHETYNIFIWIDRITVVIFIIDYLLRWGTADLKFIKHGKYAFIYYPITPFAVIDLLSILPSLTILGSGFKLFRLLRLAKSLKVFRSLKVLRYSKSFEIIKKVIHNEKKPLCTVAGLAVGYIIICALVMFSVEPQSFNTFFDAVYWAVVTLTTVGYGDIYPISAFGKIVSMLSSFIGIAIIALPTGIIAAGYMAALKESKEKE
ncbi:MAG TPA: ion transporter [Oscillospiraceae bacterium]|nr:ion transporter [Oscillospiraceae bacterium]HPF55437.1 ion transporter [Clostridiales bacterium]HPK36248.1 ion transporter [Oscillospiraceae bacterium]HPR75484.1 ion transporter [Oscillospiraceae bacterium]